MTTPIRRQYLDVKARHPDAILLFRLGDFYEAFDDDAKLVAAELGITLTSKPMGKNIRVPLAGVPHHALESYLARLIARGHRIAICEQLADPATTKGLVPRDVVRVVTPGTQLESAVVEGRVNSYLVAIAPGGVECGLAWADLGTGEFATSVVPNDDLPAELARLGPAELLLPPGEPPPAAYRGAHARIEPPGDREAERALLAHFGAATLDAYGCAGRPAAIRAAAMVLAYVGRTAPTATSSLSSLTTRTGSGGLRLDVATRRNLELFPESRGPTADGSSLLEALDLTSTAAGARTLRRWLAEPLGDAAAIGERQEQVAFLLESAARRGAVAALLRSMPDIGRLVARVVAGYATPREVATLRRGLDLVPEVIAALGPDSARFPGVRPLPEIAGAIAMTLAGEPPATLDDGGVIREGCSPELDALRAVANDARGALAALEASERERTGIRTLRVGYQRAFGYYIEVGNSHRDSVPGDYEPRQTLVAAQRYVTKALREHETRALGARERIVELETGIFRRLCAQIGDGAPFIRGVAGHLAELDVYVAFAEAASRYGYTRPHVDDSDAIEIDGGRHPVVERLLGEGGFVPNDTRLDRGTRQIIVITGPNMAGKSTYLRQVALIALMAHVGCYVPATSARIGVLDRIFTRVGAHDDLSAGRSTFMVEMVETATILHQATPRSLVVLDEVGRGTSTYDGLAIARAVVEYLHHRPELGAKTLFATHYHELTALAGMLPRVHNENVAVSEEGGAVTFLYRILPGGADRSYGIHVAQLAGLPRAVIARSEEILAALESDAGPHREGTTAVPGAAQMTLFARDPLLADIAALDVDAMTPLEAMTRLYELRDRARNRE